MDNNTAGEEFNITGVKIGIFRTIISITHFSCNFYYTLGFELWKRVQKGFGFRDQEPLVFYPLDRADQERTRLHDRGVNRPIRLEWRKIRRFPCVVDYNGGFFSCLIKRIIEYRN